MSQQYQFFELDIPTWSNDLDHLENSITNDNANGNHIDNSNALAEYQLNSAFDSALSSAHESTISSISSASSNSESLISNGHGNYNYHYSTEDSLYPLKAVLNDIPTFNGNSIESNTDSNTLQLSSPLSSCVSPILHGMKMQNFQDNQSNYNLQDKNNQLSHSVPSYEELHEINLDSSNEDKAKLKEETNTQPMVTPPPSAPKRSKSGRVKKPMTLVQRKAHNKIERKYRININSKIANLQKLVPWMSEDGVAFEVDSKHLTEDISEMQMQSNKKLNKSMILDMVTEYILLLKDECKKKDDEIKFLKDSLSS